MQTVKVEEIGDSVEVVAWFRAGRLTPLRFKWRGRTYKVKQVTGDWRSEVGATHFHHFAVTGETPDVYELAYNERSYVWKLQTVAISG